MSRQRRLHEMQDGEVACVADVEGNDTLAQRLMEMGFLAGTTVQLLGRAPWGEPLEYLVRGTRLSLRKREAERIVLTDRASAGSTSGTVLLQ
ncbi:MAG: iron transporter FeoA [Planctomycetaceae bacterium]|nr:MAG: iron transporter FeoA [Planctomycetaceae bacterium]